MELLKQLKIYAVSSNFLLVTYTVAADINNVFTYEDWAMVIDLRGNIRR